MDALVEINRYLDRWLLRYRQRRAVRWAWRGLLVGLSSGALITWWAVPRVLIVLNQFIPLTLSVALAGLVIAGSAGFLWPIKRASAIRFFDRCFNLQERVSAAVEFSEGQVTSNSLLAAQRQDTLEHVRQVNLNLHLPWRISWLELGAALVLILIITGLTVRYQPHFLAATQKQHLIKHTQEQATRLEEIQSNIEKLDILTPEQRKAIDQPLENVVRRLTTAQSLEEALSALNEAEEALRSLTSAERQNQAAGLQQAGDIVRSQKGSALEAFGEYIAQGDFSQAAQELDSLNLSGLNNQQQNQLSGDLLTAAEALTGTSSELAQDLQDAAAALQSGESSEAEQALSQAAQSLDAQAEELSTASAASQAVAQLNASQQILAQAGSSGQAQTGGNSTQANNGQGSGQTNEPAGQESQGSGGDSSNSGSGGGAGQGESQGGGSSGSQAGSQPIDTSNQPGDGGERSYESIYAPQRLGNQAGQDVQLPGSGQPGQVIGQAALAPGASDENLIPYTQVYPAYESIVRQAIESGQIPQHLRALVRDYFSSLAP